MWTRQVWRVVYVRRSPKAWQESQLPRAVDRLRDNSNRFGSRARPTSRLADTPKPRDRIFLEFRLSALLQFREFRGKKRLNPLDRFQSKSPETRASALSSLSYRMSLSKPLLSRPTDQRGPVGPRSSRRLAAETKEEGILVSRGIASRSSSRSSHATVRR